MDWSAVLSIVVSSIEIAGVAVMVVGFALTAILAVRDLRTPDHDGAYRSARQRLGRSILLGLELLVAGDIVRTIVERPTLHSVALLASIVTIRTFLSFTLEIELTGKLPWREAAKSDSPDDSNGRAYSPPAASTRDHAHRREPAYR